MEASASRLLYDGLSSAANASSDRVEIDGVAVEALVNATQVRECAFEERLTPACTGRLSCSLASLNVPATFDLEGWGGTVGVVVRPDVTRKCVLCSWAWDGWTDLRGCNRSSGCVPGCVGTVHPTHDVYAATEYVWAGWGPYKPREGLRFMIEEQQRQRWAWPWNQHTGRTKYNELVLSSNCWRRHLPSLVLAFYVTHRATLFDIDLVVATRDEFLRNYSLPAATAPLVAYDERAPAAPFSPFRRRNASVASPTASRGPSSRPPPPTQHELDWLEAVTEARAQNNDDAWWWADGEAARHGNDDYFDDDDDDYYVDDKADEEAWLKRVEEERIVKELRSFEAEAGDDDDGDIARLEAELRMRRDEIARDPQLAAMYLD